LATKTPQPVEYSGGGEGGGGGRVMGKEAYVSAFYVYIWGRWRGGQEGCNFQ